MCRRSAQNLCKAVRAAVNQYYNESLVTVKASCRCKQLSEYAGESIWVSLRPRVVLLILTMGGGKSLIEERREVGGETGAGSCCTCN